MSKPGRLKDETRAGRMICPWLGTRSLGCPSAYVRSAELVLSRSVSELRCRFALRHLRPSLATLKERLARPAQAQSTDRDLTAGLQGERVHSLGGFACAGDVRAAYMRLLSAWNPDPADPASIELFSCPVCKEVWAHKHQEDRCPVLATPADLAMIEYHHGSGLALASLDAICAQL